MFRRLLPLALLASTAFAQQPCDTVDETRQLRETLREVVRVQILTEELRWEQTRIAALRDERKTHAETVEAFDAAAYKAKEAGHDATGVDTQTDFETERMEARRKLAATDASIAAAEKRVDVLLTQLREIAARLDQPRKPDA